MTTTELPPTPDETAEPSPRIDPRIRARRIAVRREEGRKRLRRLQRLSILLAVVLGGWLATRSPLLDVDHIDVRGNEHATPDELRAASRIATGDPMTDVETGAATVGVETVPWVREATVERRWPNRVTITVTERTAVAVLGGADGRWWLVDADGRVLAQVPDASSAIAIEGANSDGAAPEPGAELEGTALLAVRVATLVPSDLRAVTAAIELADGDVGLRLLVEGERAGTVRLGPPQALEAKLLAAATVVQGVDLGCVRTLDVRVPSAPVLTTEPRCG